MSKYVCACVCVPQWQRETAPLPRRRVTEGRGMPSMLSALQSPFVQGDPALRVLQRSSVDNQPIDTKKVNSQDRGKKEGGGDLLSSFFIFVPWLLSTLCYGQLYPTMEMSSLKSLLPWMPHRVRSHYCRKERGKAESKTYYLAPQFTFTMTLFDDSIIPIFSYEKTEAHRG